LAGFVEGVGEDGENDFALGAADEIEAAFLLDELELGRHSRKRCTRQHRREISRCARNDGAGVGAFGSIHRIGDRINGKIEGRERNFEDGERECDLYQIGTDAPKREGEEFSGEFAAESVTAETKCGEERGAAAGEGVEDVVAFVGRGEEDAFEEGDRLLRGVLAEFFLPGFGRTDFPDGFHLLAAIGFLHELVMEGVARLGALGGPDDGFGGVSEVAAGKIGRRIGLDPGNVVEELEAELLHGEADGMNDVGGAGNPDGAVGLEDALCGGEPGPVEIMIGVRTAGFVPFAFVDADHLAGVAGDAAVGKEIGRVGEDEVDGGFGEESEEFEAVPMVDAEVMFGVVEGGSRQGIGREFGHDDDRSGSLIRWAMESREGKHKARWHPKGMPLRKEQKWLRKTRASKAKMAP